jgi:hypothetical protein
MSEGMLRVLQPEGWAPAKGYANGIAARGEMIFYCRHDWLEWPVPI